MMLASESGYVALGALVTAAAGALAMLVKEWASTKKSRRADAIAEWREITDRQQAEIVGLLKREAECRANEAALAGEVRLLQQSVRRLESDRGMVLPSRLPGLVVADLDGVIKTASPALAPILHWLPQDLMGKTIDLIIPERLRGEHRAALARVKAAGQPPWPERTLLTYALTREGAEVPVSVRLYGWQAGDRWLISAEISRRTSSAEAGDIPTPMPYRRDRKT